MVNKNFVQASSICANMKRQCSKIPQLHFYSSVWSTIKQGSTPILNKGKWSNLLIPIAPIEEQKAIIEKVECLMDKCRELIKRINSSENNAKMLMQAVLKEAFEGGKKENKINQPTHFQAHCNPPSCGCKELSRQR